MVPKSRLRHDIQAMRACEAPDRTYVGGVWLLKILKLLPSQTGTPVRRSGEDPTDLMSGRMAFRQ
jgi:hypothetical protein